MWFQLNKSMTVSLLQYDYKPYFYFKYKSIYLILYTDTLTLLSYKSNPLLHLVNSANTMFVSIALHDDFLAKTNVIHFSISDVSTWEKNLLVT